MIENNSGGLKGKFSKGDASGRRLLLLRLSGQEEWQ